MYAGAIQQEQMGDTAYVMRMQAQLCKAMHSMGILNHQFELAKKHFESVSKLLKDNLATLTEEKSRVELELMNDLMKADTLKREVENDLMSRMDDIQTQMAAEERQIEENENEDGSGAQDEEELDQEEKEAKEEWMQMLRERRLEIDRLEKAIEAQSEEIEELEGDGSPKQTSRKQIQMTLSEEEEDYTRRRIELAASEEEDDEQEFDDTEEPLDENGDVAEDSVEADSFKDASEGEVGELGEFVEDDDGFVDESLDENQ